MYKPSHKYTYAPGYRMEQDGWTFKTSYGKLNATLSIDSSSGFLYVATFGIGETNVDHLANIGKVFEKFGKPMKSIFDKRAGIYGEGKAQIRDVLEKCEVEVFTSSDPNAKPKVERTNRTLENDFIYVYFINHKIDSIEKANEYSERFVDAYNKKFNKTLNQDSDESMFLPVSQNELDYLNVSYKIKTLDDQTMYFRNKRYGFLNSRGVRVYVSPGIKQMYIDYKQKMWIIDGRRKVWCNQNYVGQKVVLPETSHLIKLATDFKLNNRQLTRKEINELMFLLDKKISLLKLDDNSDTI